MFCCIITGNKHLFITIKQKMTNVEVLCILSLGWLTGARWWTFSLKFPMKLIMCNFCDSLSIFDNWNGRDNVNINRKIMYCPSQIYKPGSYMLKFELLLVDITVYYFLVQTCNINLSSSDSLSNGRLSFSYCLYAFICKSGKNNSVYFYLLKSLF